jgi:hypothetical protein
LLGMEQHVSWSVTHSPEAIGAGIRGKPGPISLPSRRCNRTFEESCCWTATTGACRTRK